MAEWLARTPAAADVIQAMQSARVVPDAEVAEWTLPSVYARFPQAEPRRPVRPRPTWPAMAGGVGAAAAALALLVAGAGLVWRHAASDDRTNPEAARTYVSHRGQIATLTLPSGTTIQLAPLSRLTVQGNEATLEGEAVFTVTHHTAEPFVVHARNATTRVLGTRFDIRAYAEDSSVQVAVAEGKVAVNAVVLTHDDVAHVGPGGHVDAIQRDSAVGKLLEWTRGTLVFDNAPLRDVAVQLSRWYGVDFVLADPSIGRRLLTTTVKPADAVDTVMRIIALSTNTSFERRGDTIVISTAKRAQRVIELSSPSRYVSADTLSSHIPTR